MVKLKPRTNILLDIGETSLTMLETIGLHYGSLLSPTTRVSTTRLEKPNMRMFLGPNHNIPCPSSWDFIGINTNFNVHIFCKDLPSHSHSENSLKKELLDNLLQPQLSQALLERERTFKQNCSSTFERCREQTSRSHVYSNRFRLGHHLKDYIFRFAMTDVCENWRRNEVNKKIELKSDATTILIHTITDEGWKRNTSIFLTPPTVTICAVYCLQTSTYSVTFFVETRSILFRWHSYSSGLTINFSVLWAQKNPPFECIN